MTVDAAPIVWFTGLSGAGKSTLAQAVFVELRGRGLAVELLDADRLRPHLWPDLGFSQADREENVRRLGFVAVLLARHSVITLVAAMSPYRKGRDEIRSQHAPGDGRPGFIEVYVDAPPSVCEQRDPVGLYRRYRQGLVRGLSGMDAPYEMPLAAEVHCQTAEESVDCCVMKILDALGVR